MGKRMVFQWLFSQTLGAPATLLTSVPGTPERTLKSTLEGMWGWHVPHDSWLLFQFFFSPIFLNWKKGWWGKQQKQRVIHQEVGVWSFFLFSNLLYKGCYIRVMVLWRFFQDVFSMFHVSLRCPLLEPLFQSMDVFGEVKFCILQSSRRIGRFSTAWVMYKRKTSDLKQFFREKKDPHETFAFVFLPWFIYIPLKKRQLGLCDLHMRWGKQFHSDSPTFLDFSRAIVLPVIEMLVERRGWMGHWEVPSS